jgi:hypothetical protein
MILQLEDRWGTLALLEYEHGAREALLALWHAGDLRFEVTQDADKENFIRNTAAAYAAQSFRQAKEFFRHAETSSWLVKPLLLYYGMLSAVKAALTFATPDFFLTPASGRHGIGRLKMNQPALMTDCLKVQNVGVFRLARTAIGGPALPPGTQLPVYEILRRLPEAVVTFKLVSNNADAKLIFTRNPWVATSGPNQPFRIIFEIPIDEVTANQSDLPATITSDYTLLPNAQSKVNVYGSNAGWNTERDAQTELFRGEPEFLSPMLDGSRSAVILPFMINGTQCQFTEIELIFLITFYFSEIARYMPHVWLQIHSGAQDFSVLLCQDILRSCENKFLQLLQNRLTYTVAATFRSGGAFNAKP